MGSRRAASRRGPGVLRAGYQRRIFAVIASAWPVDPIDVALLTSLLGSIVAALGLTPTGAAQLVGNVVAGTASDRFGRNAVFQVTMVVGGLAGPAAAARPPPSLSGAAS